MTRFASIVSEGVSRREEVDSLLHLTFDGPLEAESLTPDGVYADLAN
jgi:hypothetical protein